MEIYRRGHLWLDFERDAAGKPLRPNLYIFWYDAEKRRIRRRSTGTSDTGLGITALDEAYLASFNTKSDTERAYTLGDVLADYYLEVGSKRSSAVEIRSRLRHVRDFLQYKAASVHERNRPPGFATLEAPPSIVDDVLLEEIREWLRSRPIEHRSKDGVVTTSKPRSEATLEEAIHQLKAALNHAVAKKRIDPIGKLKSRSREAVSPEVRSLMSVDELGKLLRYTMDERLWRRRLTLRRYLILAVATVARPDAILDLSLDWPRDQWYRDKRVLHLNPKGRTQTKKRRASIGVIAPLHNCLSHTEQRFGVERLKSGPAFFVSLAGEKISGIKSAWRSARTKLGFPIEWGPKIIRHSIATELRHHNVDSWELQGWLGHRNMKTTEVYAKFRPNNQGTVGAALEAIIAEIERICPGAFDPKVDFIDSSGLPRQAADSAE